MVPSAATSDRFLAKPDPAIRVVLVHGGDDGLVSERVAAFVKAVTAGDADPFSHVRLDSAAIAEDPARLADEALAVPMFGGRRAIEVRLTGTRPIHSAVESVLDLALVDAWVVIAAGELRKTAPLRKLCESHPKAAAIACYPDTGRDLDRLIDEEMSAAGLSIAADARTALKSQLGSDRLASRGEVRKLALYAADGGSIGLDDVRAIVGDASTFAVDEAVDAVAAGDLAGFDRAFRRLVASGTPGFVVAAAAIRHFDFLHRARAAVDGGASVEQVIGRASPPIFFKRRDDVARALSAWSRPRIERALRILDQAVIDSRLRAAITDEVVGQALAMIAALAAAARRS